MEDLSKRTLRELLTLARERLGTGASGLKTRDEVLAALAGEPVVVSHPVAPPPAPPPVVIVRDFFRRQG